MFFIYPRLHNLDASPLGRGKKNGIVWEKFPRRLRRLYGKIAEVIWEDCGGYVEKFQTKSPYNLRNLLGNFSHIIPFFSDRVPFTRQVV